MSKFSYFQPTEICFGAGRIKEVGEVVRGYGKRCLLVTGSNVPSVEPMFTRLMDALYAAGIIVAHFDGVIPNPTTDIISNGAEMATAHGADVVLGVGGGSSMDTAKAIAVEATHEGTSWDYLFYRDTQPTDKTLPVIAVSTTSGTGSQVTQVAVITNTKKRDKSAIYHSIIYPKVAIVDPELMLTVSEHITASTGFDAFCHAFESMLHPNASPYITMMAEEAIKLVLGYLSTVVKKGSDMEARTAMAWADTLAGLCIANAGVTLPHGIGMAIGGMYPSIMHGETLALNYPVFTRYTCPHAIKQFAILGRLFNPGLKSKTDEEAAEKACEELDSFLKEIGMWFGLADFNIPKNELDDLAKQALVLPDYKNNPRVATVEETKELLLKCYQR
ncbi:MAG TPA: iron-containing alcohol dehydrogenase [Candidatus Marinimicrobia bacterium]|nr:iron-containing alcohol dehydrogenase [Candidatus Neomarinimicrobiota bacterium]